MSRILFDLSKKKVSDKPRNRTCPNCLMAKTCGHLYYCTSYEALADMGCGHLTSTLVKFNHTCKFHVPHDYKPLNTSEMYPVQITLMDAESEILSQGYFSLPLTLDHSDIENSLRGELLSIYNEIIVPILSDIRVRRITLNVKYNYRTFSVLCLR